MNDYYGKQDKDLELSFERRINQKNRMISVLQKTFSKLRNILLQQKQRGK